MAPLPKSKAKPAKVVKGAVADAVSFGSVNITKEDVKTIAAMVRFGAVQGDAESVSQKLGITKNAWSKRWKRVKTKLDSVTIDTVDGAQTGETSVNAATPGDSSDIAPDNEDIDQLDINQFVRPEDSDLPFF